MVKSMTGFSKTEASENGVTATIEIKSLNGRYLDINARLPRTLSHREFEIRELIKAVLSRGSVSVSINLEHMDSAGGFAINEDMALKCYESLVSLAKKLKLKETVKIEHVLSFSNTFYQKEEDEETEQEWLFIKKTIRECLKNLEKMRTKEGQQIMKDIQNRVKNIMAIVENIETLGFDRVPAEREKLRQKIAMLFESDEIDEHRLQMEIVLLANRLDISEECVRLRSHIKFFYDTIKSAGAIGQKLTFLLQEMNREINTIGSKADDAQISQLVVNAKEELERIREQTQNIE